MKLFNKDNDLRNKVEYLEKQLQVFVGNDLFRGLYQYLPKGIKLQRDDNIGNYIKQGYESNPDVFAISNHIAGLFARVPVKAFKGETEVDDPVKAYFDNNSADYTYHEFRYNWEMFNLITGNAIVYFLRRALGNNAGSVNAFDIMPTQNVEIESGGWRQPVGLYKLDLDNRYSYKPENVWHTRLFPNLDYTDGKNFIGMSPIKVAATVILAQNAGYEMTADMLRNGIPPGILTKKGEYDKKLAEEQEDQMRRKWRRASKNKLPLFTLGELNYLKLGYDSLKDMQVIENSTNGMRILCNIWAVPLQAFNDTSASTYNNMKEADKAIYKKRVMPDHDRYIAGLNKIFKEDGITFESDYSGIEALQENREELVNALAKLNQSKLIGRDEARQILNDSLTFNLEEIEIEGMSLEDMLNEPQVNTINLNNNDNPKSF